MVNNVLTYGPDGKVVFHALNYPGSWTDGSLMACFSPQILKRIGNYKICADQGCLGSAAAWNVLLGPLNQLLATPDERVLGAN